MRLKPAFLMLLALGSLSTLAVPAQGASRGFTYPRLPAGRASFVHQPRASSSRMHHRTPRTKPRPKLSREQLTFQRNTNRAIAAYAAMQHYFYLPGSGLYKGTPQYSFLWPFSQALAATVSLANVNGLTRRYASELRARLFGLHYYFDADNSGSEDGAFTSSLPGFDGSVAPPKGPGGAKYYDDNEWVGIELVRTFELTGQVSALEDAERIMAFVMSGWQANPRIACTGGVPFSNSPENSTRNTVTGGPGAELAVQLYWITGDSSYLAFAEMAYQWVRSCLQQPNLLYADHLGSRGIVEQTFWSYNQGSMIGAGALLYQATGNGAFLYQARQTAQAALAYFTPARLSRENPFFVCVYFRNLLYLDALTGDPPGPAIAQSYVDYLASHHLSSTGLFATSSYSPQLLVQASVIQVYALLNSPPATYF